METPRGFLIIPLQISISVKLKVFTASESSKGKLAALLIIAGLRALSIFAGEEAVPMDVDFEQFKWKNRLLLIFAPDSSHPLFESLQRDISTRKHEVDDRDLSEFLKCLRVSGKA